MNALESEIILLLLLLFSTPVELVGVGEDEIHGKNAMKRTNIVMVITNCEKKEERD